MKTIKITADNKISIVDVDFSNNRAIMDAMKADFARAITSDESIKSELSVDMSEVVNEQEVETVDAEYSEVPSDETSGDEGVSNE